MIDVAGWPVKSRLSSCSTEDKGLSRAVASKAKTQAVKQSHDLAMLCRLSADEECSKSATDEIRPGVGPHVYKDADAVSKTTRAARTLSGDQRANP